MKTINLQALSSSLTAYKNCIKGNNTEWIEKHQDRIKAMLEDLPSGSGLDNGVSFSFDESSDQKLVFKFGFHHMNSEGYYDGWTRHVMTVTPKFGTFGLKINGKDKNNVKEYLYDLFFECFS